MNILLPAGSILIQSIREYLTHKDSHIIYKLSGFLARPPTISWRSGDVVNASPVESQSTSFDEWSETPVYMQLLYVLVLIRKNSGVLYLDLFKNQTGIYIGSP